MDKQTRQSRQGASEPVQIGDALQRYFGRGPNQQAKTVQRDRQQMRLPLNRVR